MLRAPPKATFWARKLENLEILNSLLWPPLPPPREGWGGGQRGGRGKRESGPRNWEVEKRSERRGGRGWEGGDGMAVLRAVLVKR